MNITEKAILNLLQYYSLPNPAQLANKLDISQGVISNWKSRNAIGALVDTIFQKDEEALKYIFSPSTGTNINQGNYGRASGRDYIENSNNQNPFKDEFTIALLKKLLIKYGDEDKLQKALMEIL